MRLNYRTFVLSGLLMMVLFSPESCSRRGGEGPRWPSDVRDMRIVSSLDGAPQPAKFWSPSGREAPTPLLVALHTWSNDYTQPNLEYLDWCRERGWTFIHPDFRGPDNNPQATGSPAAIRDVIDAVGFARKEARIDTTRIYLGGASGGGYMSLLTAAMHPEIWAGVSAWVPIADLVAWYQESRERGNKYADDVTASCGGPPGSSEEIDREYRRRSPLYHLQNARGLPLDINAGIHDGHTGSVPISHSLNAFNVLARANGVEAMAIPAGVIDYMVEKEAVPDGIETGAAPDPLYGRTIYFRRQAGPARVTIFEGGHEIIHKAALTWLEKQRRD